MEKSETEGTSLHIILDDISELIYIADIENHEILYMNGAGMKQFDLERIETGAKCYSVLQNLDEPCPFCTNKYLQEGQDYVWDFTNSISGRYYHLKDRLIQWNGRKARMEIAFDTTEIMEERESLRYSLDMEKMLLECVRVLNEKGDISRSLNLVLGMVGEYLLAERVYIFEIKGENSFNSYEWCAKDIPTEKEQLQKFAMTVIESWKKEFKQRHGAVIDDVESLEDTALRDALKARAIKNLVMAPLEYEGKLIGCFGVDNPPVERVRNISSLLETLRYFIMLTIQKNINEKLLERLSLHDTLTGLYNRNKYILDVMKFSGERSSLGIVYLDVNGLKEINDRYGHAYGDMALIKCTEKMKRIFGDANIYRTGGDEFIVIAALSGEEELIKRKEELKHLFQKDVLCSVAIGCQWAAEPSSLEKFIEEADNFMYEDKKRYYDENFPSGTKRQHCIRNTGGTAEAGSEKKYVFPLNDELFDELFE